MFIGVHPWLKTIPLALRSLRSFAVNTQISEGSGPRQKREFQNANSGSEMGTSPLPSPRRGEGNFGMSYFSHRSSTRLRYSCLRVPQELSVAYSEALATMRFRRAASLNTCSIASARASGLPDSKKRTTESLK